MTMTEAHILEYYNERAAIAQHCGGLERTKANLQAYFELRKLYKGKVPKQIEDEYKEARGMK